MKYMVCKNCNTVLKKGVALLTDIRNYGITGLRKRADRTGQVCTVRSSGCLYHVHKCEKCGYSVSEGNSVKHNVKDEGGPSDRVARTQATTGEELVNLLRGSPLQQEELKLADRDRSTGRVATYDE